MSLQNQNQLQVIMKQLESFMETKELKRGENS